MIIKSIAHSLKAALNHWKEVTGEWLIGEDSYGLWSQLEAGTTLWIQISTGQLCIQVNDDKVQDPTLIPWTALGNAVLEFHLTFDTNVEEKILSTIFLDNIHDIFSTYSQWHQVHTSGPGTILLGSLSWPMASCTHLFNPFSEISVSTCLGLQDVYASSWEYANSTHWGTSSRTEGLVI
jgi:hypothetical protein